MYTLGTAAREVGVSKSAIYRAVKSGRLSATRTDAGDYSIEPSELFRWRDANVSAKRDETPPERPETAVLQAETVGLKQVAELMRHQLDDVRADRDHWRGQAERLSITAAAAPAPKPTAVPTVVVHRSWWPWRRAG